MPRHALLGVFTTTLLLSLIPLLLPNQTLGMDSAFAQPANPEAQKAEADRLFEQGSQQYRGSQWQAALQSFQTALEIYRAIGDRAGEAKTLGNIGLIYRLLGDYSQALDYQQQALTLFREIGNRAGEAGSLGNIGLIYGLLGNYLQALEYYQQALTLSREIGDRANEAATLNNLGYLREAQNQPELAIVFYKQSVNRYETIREDNRTLTEALQNSYTATVADTYRALADLLLEQGRILEAQQVLELLKVEELREYTEERSILTTDGIQLTETEQRIVQDHDSLVAFGQRVKECQRTQCSELNQLLEQRELLTQQFNQTVQTFETEV